MAALTIRKDRTPVMLRKLAKAEEDARVGRRMLAIANALDGMSREAAAQAAGMDRQTLRDWVIRYNENGIDGLLDRWDGGRPPRLEADELAELYAIVMAGPDPEIDGICAFTREDLVRICEKRFDKTMHRATMGRLLRSMGLSRQKARPSHPQKDPASQEAFKKSPATPQASACACSSRTRPASARRVACAASGGSAASVLQACATSASLSPTFSRRSSPAPTTPSRSCCHTPTPRRCRSSLISSPQRSAKTSTSS
jgi:transposase